MALVKRLSALAAFCTFSLIAIAQTHTVTGTVLDGKDMYPIPGAAVMGKGTVIGTATDFDGRFALTLPDSVKSLTASFIGMRRQTVSVEGKTEIVILLEPDVVGLEEVTVTAPYSRQSKDSYSGSVTMLRPSQMETKSEASVDKMLQGAAPGVQANNASGQPGTGAEVRLRGTGSLTAGSSPLYVIDGVPVTSDKLTQLSDNGNGLSNINPADIESISILKDAAAAALYGSRASNGVIMITTKSGKAGKTKYNFATLQGISQRTGQQYKMMDATEYNNWKRQSMINRNMSEDQIKSNLESDTINTDWMDEVYRIAYTQSYEFSTSGGNEKTNFYLSGQHRNEQGIVIGTDYKSFGARANITHKATDKLQFGTKSSISTSTQNSTAKSDDPANPVTAAYMLRPTLPVYHTNGSYYFNNQTYNPVGIAALNTNESKTNRYSGNVFAQYDPLKAVQLKTIFNADFINLREFTFISPETPDGQLMQGLGTVANTKAVDLTSSNTASFNKTFAEFHAVSAVVGYEAQSKSAEQSMAQAGRFATGQVHDLSSASVQLGSSTSSEDERMVSFLSSVQYSLHDRYYITGSARRDGSSKFSPDHRWANFWSTGLSWRISEEPFMSENQNINSLKLRASYGTSGNSDIRNYAYMSLMTYGENYNEQPGGAVTTIGNNDLTWEKNTTADLGLDMRIYKRFTASVEVYNRRTYDLLLDVPISMTTGFTHQLQNVGEMVNRGVELSAGAEIISRERFKWTTDFNISHNKNKIIALNNDEDIISGSQIQRVGQSYNTFYLIDWAGVDPASGMPLWYDTLGNVTKTYANARRHLCGSPDPIFTAGLTNSFTYRNWDASFMLFLSYGNKIYNNLNKVLLSDGAYSEYNQVDDASNMWIRQGDHVDNPSAVFGNWSNSNSSSDRYLEDGSYLRLKSVSIGYTLQNSRLHKDWDGSMRIYATGTNLWTLTRYSGIDPEQNLRGVEFFSYPNAQSVSLGLNLNF